MLFLGVQERKIRSSGVQEFRSSDISFVAKKNGHKHLNICLDSYTPVLLSS